MSAPTPFAGRTAIVTGASGGIGHAIAARLVTQGARVFGLFRSEGALAKLSADHPGQVIWLKCDVADRAHVEAAVARVGELTDRTDMLVNNVGIARGAPDCFWEQDFDDIATVIATNVAGLVTVTHAALRALLIPQGDGTILTISSVTGLEVPVSAWAR